MAEPHMDAAAARFALDHMLASDEQIDEARAAQREAASEGLDLTLVEILVDHGAITAAQRELIEQQIAGPQKPEIDHVLHYTIKSTIGVGGMGAVYLGEDDHTKRPVAVKVLAKQFTDDAEFLKRFHHEADAAARLQHVNIARAFSVGEDQGRHFYVMEYCEGETLAERIAREGFIPADEATRIIIQLARGLKHAHEKGLIHRDVKPSNVRVSPSGTAKILDFGLSKRIGDVELLSGERHGAIGSPHYMSPEQARRDPRVDGRADIYSLGVTYYHCVTGDTPFHGRTASEIVAQHLGKRVRDPRDIRDEIPDGVAHVIRRMMAKSPSDRYLDCKLLLEDLKRVASEVEPASAAIDEGLSSVALPAVKRPPRRQFVRKLRPAPRPSPRPATRPTPRLPSRNEAAAPPGRPRTANVPSERPPVEEDDPTGGSPAGADAPPERARAETVDPPERPRVQIEQGDGGGGGGIAAAVDGALESILPFLRRAGRRLTVWTARGARAVGRGVMWAFGAVSALFRRGAKAPADTEVKDAPAQAEGRDDSGGGEPESPAT